MADIPVTSKKTGKTTAFNQDAKKPRKQPYFSNDNKKEKLAVETKKDLVENQTPSSLFECVSDFYQGKVSKTKLLEKLKEPVVEALTTEQLNQIFTLINEKDLDLKKTRIISECLVNVSCYNKERYVSISVLLERVFIQYVKPKFQRVSILYNVTNEKDLKSLNIEIKEAIDQLKRNNKIKKSDESTAIEKSANYLALEDNLTLIACAWLHYSEKISTLVIISSLSRTVFNIEKEAKGEQFIATTSLEFILSAGKKNDVDYFINFLINNLQNTENQLHLNETLIGNLTNHNEKVNEQLELQIEKVAQLEAKNNQLKNEIDALTQDLQYQKELIQHGEIHLKDVNSKTRGQFLRFLESDFLNMLIDVQKGLERTPPKIEVAKSYLEIIVKKIEEQIKCLK